MFSPMWLILSTLLYSLQLSTGSFPKPLTEEEERHYVDLARKGDLEARNILVERNLRLVSHIMKKYYTQTSDQEDLISIGTIGLIKGITTFSPEKGAKLATYAARCIENAIPSPAPLLSGSLHPRGKTNPAGTFWTGFPRIFTFFVRRRIAMCGMCRCLSTASRLPPPAKVWKGIAAMSKSEIYRTGSGGAGTPGD